MKRFALVRLMLIDIDDTNWAIENGLLPYLKYLKSKSLYNTKYNQSSMNKCCERNTLHVLQFCDVNISPIKNCSNTPQLMATVASKGNLKMLKYMHSVGCYADYVADINAASNGHVDVLDWLNRNHEYGCSKEAMVHAAKSGQFNAVKWLQQNVRKCFKISVTEIEAAAENGHFEVVKWMYKTYISNHSYVATR